MSDSLSQLIVPAPIWRRFAASIYDGLLLLGLWMVTLLLSLPLNRLLAQPPGGPLSRALLFIVGLGFFAWFWTRGGQTLGMRAWRLQVRRELGGSLRLPIAAVRYTAMLIFWGLVLTPIAARLIGRSASLSERLPHAGAAATVAGIVVVLSLIAARLDGRRRLPHDWIAGSEVVHLPMNPFPAEKPVRVADRERVSDQPGDAPEPESRRRGKRRK